METNLRTLTKAMTWQTSGFLAMCLLGYAMTGSIGVAGQFAIISTALGFVMFFLHERLWARIRWGKRNAQS